jgi:small subunit ribosomal protein S6
MPLYDLMLLLDPGAPSDRQETILRDVQGLLESGGTLVGDYDWGTRRMTFEIDHRPDAAYHLFQFETEGGGALLEQVDHSLKITDGVLRHRIIRLKDGAPVPPMPRPEGRGGYEGEGFDAGSSEVPAAGVTTPDADGDATATATPDAPEGGQPADAPATAGTAAAEQPATPADAPAPAPAETPPPPETNDQEAGPAGGGGDDVAPSGPTAA